jgi:hypothetical protein
MKFVGLASLVLAAVVGANTASAGFLLLDDFDDSNTPTGFELGRQVLSNGVVTNYGGATGQVTTSGGSFQNSFVRLTGLGGHDFKFWTTFKLEVDVQSFTDPISAVAYVNGNLGSPFGGTLVGSNYVFDLAGQVSNVNALRFQFTSDSPYSITFNSLQAVPEPTTLALIGLIGAGGGAAGWRNRRKKATA